VNHLRLALHFDYFKSAGFLIAGALDTDENSRVDGSFSFGYTPHEYLELFGAMLTSSNRNHRSGIGEPPRRDPELIKSFGDLVLGGKTALPVARGMTPTASPRAAFGSAWASRCRSSKSRRPCRSTSSASTTPRS
jgi:hypothetical protein